ncbi:MAG: sialate O-acetylesterase [Chthoniobacteraceae bacterium]
MRTKTEGPIKVADVLASGNNDMPSRLCNAMIHGLEPYTLKGFLWFQGDGNFGNPQKYGELIKTLIRAWRAHFHDDTLPLYYVEMQNYHALQEKPVEPNPMSLIREAQQGALKPGEQLANLYNRPYRHGRVTGISI